MTTTLDPSEIICYVINNDISNVKRYLKKGKESNQNNSFVISKIIFFSGGNPTAITPMGLTLIGLAARDGYLEILQMMLESCYYINNMNNVEQDMYSNRQHHERTPDGMNELQWDDEFNIISDIDDDEWTQLFRYYGQVIEKTHQYLITSKQDPHALDRHNLAPLHYAAMNGHLDCVRLLIDFGCSVNIETKDGYTALHLAGAHKPVLALLLKNKANPNKITYEKLETPLMLAAIEGNISWVSVLFLFDNYRS